MKGFISDLSIRLLFAALLVASPAYSQEKHLLLGAWQVDVSKVDTPQPPKSVDIVDASGKSVHSEGTFTPDGTPARAVGSVDVDIVSITMPSRRFMVFGGGMAGRPSNTRVFSLADDGKSMIETIVRHDVDGTPRTKVNTWTRTRAP